MSGLGNRGERAPWLERASAACLGGAIGFAIYSIAAWLQIGSRFAAAVFAGLAVFSLVFRVLKAIAASGRDSFGGRGSQLAVAAEPSALLLRLQDVLAEASASDRLADELLLDDALEPPASDSRVVQLFQPGSLPTAGELQARIDRHLDGRGDAPAPADDSGELFEALASLKRSLG